MASRVNYKGRTRKGNTVVLSGHGKKGRGTSVSKVTGRKKNGKLFKNVIVTKVRAKKPKSLGSLFGLKGKPERVVNLGNGKVVGFYKRKGKQVSVLKSATYDTSNGKRTMYQLRTSKTFGGRGAVSNYY